MKWITRRNVKVDRVACPWLITRFVDHEARFLFVEEGELLEAARREEAVPFDAPRIPEVKLNHRGEHCSFEAILADFELHDSALERMALIIRAADIRGQESVAAEGAGLRALAEGFRALGLPDEQRLALQFPMDDALYAFARERKD